MYFNPEQNKTRLLTEKDSNSISGFDDRVKNFKQLPIKKNTFEKHRAKAKIEAAALLKRRRLTKLVLFCLPFKAVNRVS